MMVKALKYQTLFCFFSLIKCWLKVCEIHKMHFRIANWEDPDPTASSCSVLLLLKKQSDPGLRCLPSPFIRQFCLSFLK